MTVEDAMVEAIVGGVRSTVSEYGGFRGIAMDAVKSQLSARTGEFQEDEDVKKVSGMISVVKYTSSKTHARCNLEAGMR